MPGQKERRFPIRVVGRLTGLALDTLRGWERRYGVVRPTRDGRGRMYSEADVRRLQLLAAAVARGHSIGRIAALPDAGVEALLTELPPVVPTPERPQEKAGAGVLDPLLDALLAFDDEEMVRGIYRLALTLPPRDLVNRVVLPLMQRVGDEWHADRVSIGQEHLASAAVRNLLGAMVRLYTREEPPRRLLFATPSGERHEFGILAGALLAAAGGLGPIYAGPDLPARQIVDLATRREVDVTVLGVVYAENGRTLQRQLESVADGLPPSCELWIGGRLPKAVDRAVARHHVIRLADFADLEKQLVRVGAKF